MEWISIKNKLPVNDGQEMNGEWLVQIPVIVDADGLVFHTHFIAVNNGNGFSTDFCSDKKIDYWMFLPKSDKAI